MKIGRLLKNLTQPYINWVKNYQKQYVDNYSEIQEILLDPEQTNVIKLENKVNQTRVNNDFGLEPKNEQTRTELAELLSAVGYDRYLTEDSSGTVTLNKDFQQGASTFGVDFKDGKAVKAKDNLANSGFKTLEEHLKLTEKYFETLEYNDQADGEENTETLIDYLLTKRGSEDKIIRRLFATGFADNDETLKITKLEYDPSTQFKAYLENYNILEL